jgi:hypothetical protein
VDLQITGQTVEDYNNGDVYHRATITYLSGSIVAGSFLQEGSDYGELFDVTDR